MLFRSFVKTLKNREGIVTIPNIDFSPCYVFVFYNADGSEGPPNTGDSYVCYKNKNFDQLADPIHISKGETEKISVTFDDEYKFGKIPTTVERAEIPAFPGAEGFGAYTPGGRGGDVKFVTNLKDSGEGSFRAAVNAYGPRTVIFRVSGTIDLKSRLKINNPYITIAGQTSPGDGICLKNYPLIINTHDVVVRYLRVRPGDIKGSYPSSDEGRCDAITIRSKNVIIDHCSATWGTDETISTVEQSDHVTVQWCLIAEALENPKAKYTKSFGSLIAPETDSRISFHHNLFAHNGTRNPGVGPYEDAGLKLDFRNNVIYNWKDDTGYSNDRAENVKINYVSNYLKAGPSTLGHERNYAFAGGNIGTSIYQSGNIINGEKTGWKMFADKYTKMGSPVGIDNQYQVATNNSSKTYNIVLQDAGAILPKKDPIDECIARSVQDGNGKIIDSQNKVGGWVTLNTTNVPTDSDRDGMPDKWEKTNGLNPNNPADRNGDLDDDGYTNLEEYLHSLT